MLVYLGCGVAYAASQGVREPVKMLPNREFWAGLPAMVSAGVTFFLASVQDKSTRPVVASGGIGAAPGVRLNPNPPHHAFRSHELHRHGPRGPVGVRPATRHSPFTIHQGSPFTKRCAPGICGR